MHSTQGETPEAVAEKAPVPRGRKRRFVLFTWKPWVLGFLPMMLVGSVFAIRKTAELNREVNSFILDQESKYQADLGSLHWMLASYVRRDSQSLFQAVHAEDTYFFDKLLQAGLNPNVVNQEGLSLLNFTILQGAPLFTEKLLLHGVDVNVKDASGVPAIIQSVKLGSLENVTRLLDAGAAVNRKDENGMTALMHAASSGNNKFSQILLDKKSEINLRDNQGQTAIFHAALAGKRETVELLLARGADTQIRNLEGKLIAELLPPEGELAKLLPRPVVAVPEATASALPTPVAPESEAVAAEQPSPASHSNTVAAEKIAPAEAEKKAVVEIAPAPQFTRLRAVKPPEGVWQRQKVVTLVSVSMEVRNVGSYEAKEVSVQVRLPGGKLLPLEGPTTLKPNQSIVYSSSPGESITSDGKLKAQLSCQNCYP